ncbi:MAG: sirohydrochlorin chelatase [Mycobacterium pseudokansasii]|uniref:Sirohydrochlorin cobaltochelatase n=1 Tax=Mycobacterium pseudokansasii TaxID=2341080 RepID=A0A498QKX1_9MYCO|nr:sirohydrochlorin chelatase [Mycobacterium pseudokansasii]KZS66424.1 cobalamin biosynthesis protein CbiX [Mycobacterium kansasii]MBY0390387.1 sirohydrochlorin chelatase [Mycobacterium pseudokansasii]VAZ88270.1 Sirohydrochlorin cobaltochelatase [Mycobacterium pseudokansasii]VAZ88838.1 Sirohydrochlorin cobaltochelatase [Mycobacterium pseudokansasii]VBA46552.1 Sirohydrochlorin cobaltochelatase [Mycobacterium pseudokansasii]
MSLILTAHGTRRPAGVAMIGDLAARVSALVDQTVHVAFVDVLGPTPREVLSALSPAAVSAQHAILVPAFLSRGYHVRTDLPAHVTASGHPAVTVTPALGPSREITRILAHQLVKSGWRRTDSVILAAAGTSDHRAHADLHTARTFLSTLTGSHVELAFAATGGPDACTAVADARRSGARRVVVVSYLLAEGLFQERLRACGADLVTPPLGEHPGLARLIAGRFRSAIRCRWGSRRMQRMPN